MNEGHTGTSSCESFYDSSYAVVPNGYSACGVATIIIGMQLYTDI